MANSPSEGLGVYGLSVLGLDGASQYAGPVPSGAPTLHVRREIGTCPGAKSRLYEDRAIIPLLDEGVLEVTRTPASALYRYPTALSDAELLHPWLVPAVATVSAWVGRRVLHGGLVSNGDAAVAIVGDKEAGKSTLLAHLALTTSLTVLADDLVVFDEETAFTGPRCLDLRLDASSHLPSPRGTMVRDNARLRLLLPPAPLTSRLHGIVVLNWGAALGLRELPASERLGRVLPHALTEGIPPGNAGVLGYVEYRMWELTRPRRWEALADSGAVIRELLE